MSQGRRELRSIRMRLESSNGAGAPTPRYYWMGVGEMPEDGREIVKAEIQAGVFGGPDITYTPKLGAKIALAETEAKFTQLSDLFLAAGYTNSFGGPQGSILGAAGTSCLFRLTPPVSALGSTYSYVIEAGDNVEALQMTYCIAEEISLTFTGGEAMKVSATLMGRDGTLANASGSFSAAGTFPRTPDIVLASRGTAWLQDLPSGVGTGQVTAGNILSGEITIKPMFEPKFPVDAGQLFFHTAAYVGLEITGKLTLEHQVSGTFGAAGSAGQIEKWRRETPQVLSLQWTGGTIPGGTQTFDRSLLRFDLPIKWDTFAYSDQNGNAVAEGEFTSRFNIDAPALGRGTITIVRGGTSEFAGA